MSSIERLDSAALPDDAVIVITEPIFRSPLPFTLILTSKVVAVEPEPTVALELGELAVKPVAVAELPPLVSVIAIFPTDTLLLRLLKVIL